MQTNLDHPTCFYHPKQRITNICLHSNCILPLCQYCVQIHRKQFPQGDHMSRIISYKQAKTIALQSIKSEKQLIQKSLKQFDQKFFQFRVAIKNITQKILDELEFKLKTERFKFGSSISSLQHKSKKLIDDCLKQLINHYEHGNIFMNPRYHFNFIIQQQEASKFIGNAVIIKQQQFENIRQSGGDLKIIQPILNGSLWNNSTITQHMDVTEVTPIKAGTLTVQDLNQTPKHNQSGVQCSRTITKRRSRQGIFVASSPTHMKRMSAYHSMEARAKKSFNLQDSIKENDHHNLNRKLYSSGIFAKPSTPKQTVNSRVSQTNKSTSQYPVKVLLYKESTTTPKKKLQIGSRSQRKPKDWSNVVNKCDLASNSSSSRLAIKTNDFLKGECLNPQQMRDLIMKKRHRIQNQFANGSATKILQQKLIIN